MQVAISTVLYKPIYIDYKSLEGGFLATDFLQVGFQNLLATDLLQVLSTSCKYTNDNLQQTRF